MITQAASNVQRYENGAAVYTFTLFGTSSDNKPTDASVGNSSAFVEIDTGKVYFYDETNSTWAEWGADENE